MSFESKPHLQYAASVGNLFQLGKPDTKAVYYGRDGLEIAANLAPITHRIWRSSI